MTENNIFLYENLIKSYLENSSSNLMYHNPDTIQKVCLEMKSNIENYAKENCRVYNSYNSHKIYTRTDFADKTEWISKCVPPERIINQNTSGSTTGEPFSYYNDKKFFDIIQRNTEFDLILREYNLNDKPLKILNLFKHSYNPKIEKFFLESHNYSKRKFHSYGVKESHTFFVNWNNYMERSEEWHDKFLDFLSNHIFDVVLCSGPVINILTRHIKNRGFSHKFATLLSHTTEFAIISDFDFLKNNNNIEYSCDHMRCWDGGASFFTCKYGTYHLNDNFAWVIEGPDNKMISTDYFNLASPFINYWNGDLCKIDNEYQKCNCGRYYRPFKMLKNRPFALKGPTKLTDIKQQISQLSFKGDLIQVQFENLTVMITSARNLESNEKEVLQGILKEYQIFWI